MTNDADFGALSPTTLADVLTREQVMDDDNTEFPSIRQDLAGRPTNTAYTMHISPEKTLLFDGLVD